MNPTLIFWIAAGILLALTIAVLSWPLLRRRTTVAASRRAINAAIYRDEFAELEKDRQTGSLSEEDYRVAREELERRVLEDAADGEPAAEAPAPRGVSRTALALLLVLPLVSLPLYFVLGNPAALSPEAAAPAAQGGHGDGNGAPNMADLEKMAAALAAKLEKNPDNTQGWLMLGRSYKALGRYDDAEKAYGRVGPSMDKEPALMLEKVELAAYRTDGRIEGKALALLNEVLKQNPDNPQGLVLAGTGAFYRADYPAAIAYWERLLKQVPPGSEDAKNLNSGIAEARARMGGAPGGMAAGGEKSAPVAGGEEAKPAAAKPAAAASITGKVELAAALKAKAAPGDTVFVFAKALQGPRMPLAVVRAKVSDLPLAFTLDDSSAMSPELKLSGFPEVRVEARVSKSGDAIAKPGDLIGSVESVKPGAKGVKVVMDKVLP
ncbi:MAG: c-type cytochrome biogenesis protein CcmI [Rhodocyclaceae bacterium]|nr:c-type cytochrome biogenesis protein CcmI [Rhodocyclaceae bacterium]